MWLVSLSWLGKIFPCNEIRIMLASFNNETRTFIFFTLLSPLNLLNHLELLISLIILILDVSQKQFTLYKVDSAWLCWCVEMFSALRQHVLWKGEFTFHVICLQTDAAFLTSCSSVYDVYVYQLVFSHWASIFPYDLIVTLTVVDSEGPPESLLRHTTAMMLRSGYISITYS